MSNINEVITSTLLSCGGKTTKEELEKLLTTDPYLYLEKYGQHLKEKEIQFFIKNYKDNYEVNWYVQKQMKPQVNKNRIKNRRYHAISELDEYFSLEEMKKRRPELYSQILGKYYKQEPESFDVNMKIYERILKNYDYSTYTNKIIEQRKNDDESSPIQTDQDIVEQIIHGKNLTPKEFETSKEETLKLNIDDEEISFTVDDQEKVQLDEEEKYLMDYFTSEMKRKFIEGEDDEFFDYSMVDSDSTFDDFKQMEQDDEDRYFDE